ncbi:MAG: 4-hydroxy-tetrahydrodipicolinate synthase [Clostridia bacterium]|nr:4-hydroxy-tetrahydrodipicolinate synthase [Clostridia bacterium]
MEKTPLFKGVATALATPFDESGIDLSAFGNMIERQINAGVSAIVVCGTTGEASTLTREEKRRLTAFAAERVNGRVPVISGSGCNDTAEAIKLSKDAAEAGADALLIVTPYYNKCTQKGLAEYYKAVSEAAGKPFIAYSVPSRTGVRIEPETAAKIAELPLAYGIKDAGDSISDTARTVMLCGEKLPLYCGCDDRILPVLSLGGYGAVSVVSNLFPAETERLCDSFFEGKTKEAAELQLKLLPLIKALFCEVNPIPLKAALAEMGLCRNLLRAPLTAISEEGRKELLSNLFHL